MKQFNTLKTRPTIQRHTDVYRGHASGFEQRIIIATNENEAYALMLDALSGKGYENNEVYADPEHNRLIKAYFKHYPIGVYRPDNAFDIIKNFKAV